MSKIEKWLGLSDELDRRERAPLWKRAAWRALKTLLRRHPGAVAGAAGSAAGYAIKQGVHEGAEVLSEKASQAVEAVTPEPREPVRSGGQPAELKTPSADEVKKLIEELSAKDREVLADLARKAS